MRFPVLLALTLAWPLSLAAQRAPDASPSTPVDTVELAPFEPTREAAVLEAYVDGVVNAHMREHDTAGVTVSVVKDGRLLFAKGYGFADAQSGKLADGHETLFRIGSVSKTFIWTAVMMLNERGALDLDTDVNQYLKGFQIPDAFDAPVTLNHLMAHRAGFEDTIGVFTHSDTEDLSLTQALEADMPKRVFAPGARTSYSNWGAALAAKIVEDVSGRSYQDFIQTEIFDPLAMTATTLDGPAIMPEALRRRLSTGHKRKAGRSVADGYMEIGPYAPAGAIASTAADMAQWMLVHLGRGAYNGVTLMSPQSHDLMWRRAFDDRLFGADVAHGFMTKTYKGYAVYGHGGATAAFYSNMALVPELGIGVFVSQNATTDRKLVGQLPDLIIARLAGPVRDETAPDGFTKEKAAEYAGTYLNNRRSFTQFEKLFAATALANVAPAEEGGLLVTTQTGAVRFEPVSGARDTFQDEYGNRIVFGRNEKGAVTHSTGPLGVHSGDKVGLVGNPNTLAAALGLAGLFSFTTWLGAWRRQGRAVAHGPMGVKLNMFALAAATAFLVFDGVFVAAIIKLSSISASEFSAYPFPVIGLLRIVAYGVFGFAALSVFSLAPAWARSGWGLWRKLHHTFFALSLALLAVMLVVWKVIFSATA